MKLALTRAEIEELTERRRPAAQARVLRALGIDFRVRPDGSLLVLIPRRADGGNERCRMFLAQPPKLRVVKGGRV